MRETIPVFWANQEWCLEEGIVHPIGSLGTSHAYWTDYSTISGTTALTFTASSPTKKYRELLHKQILDKILENMDHYKVELPTCVLTHGGIASGKTSVIELWLKITASKNRKYFHIDFDRVKTQIPEYLYMKDQGMQRAAEYVQTESAKLAGKALKRAIKGHVNIIYEGSLANLDQIKYRIAEMRRKDFTILVLSSHVSEKKGQQRAIKRYQEGGRFIKEEVIRGTYLNCPKSLQELKGLVDFLFLVDNECDNQPARPILQIKGGTVEILDPTLYSQYLQVVGYDNKLD